MKTKTTLCILLLVLSVLCLSAAFADDTYATGGDGKTTVCFYVESRGSAKVYFSQTEGKCYEFGTQLFNGEYGLASEWGKYHIRITDPDGYISTEDWNKTYYGGSFSISLKKTGVYRVRVIPYTDEEINDTYLIDKFMGWSTQPSWWISDTKNCTCSATDPAVRYDSGTVTIRCFDEYGNFFQSIPLTIRNSQYIAPYKLVGYEAISTSSVYVTLDRSTGTCSPSTIDFYYRKSTPVQKPGTVTIYGVDESGWNFHVEKRTIYSSQTIDPPSISGYKTVSTGKYVTYDASTGTCSPSVLYFYYQSNRTPDPVVPGPSGSSGAPYRFPTAYYSLTLKSNAPDIIRPQCGPGTSYATFYSKNNGKQLYNTSEIWFWRAHFCVGDWVYAEFGYSDTTIRYGFFAKSLFSNYTDWNSIPVYSLSEEKTGTITTDTVPYSAPTYEGGRYQSCELAYGKTVYACLESSGWYFCRFYDTNANHYGDVYLWVPGSSIRWN